MEENLEETLKLHLDNARNETDDTLREYHLGRAEEYILGYFNDDMMKVYLKDYTTQMNTHLLLSKGFKEGDYPSE